MTTTTTTRDWETIVEGLAKVQFRKGEVFYNPVQAVNRDLSVLVLQDFVQTRRAELEEARRKRELAAAAEKRELSGREKAFNSIANEGFTVLEGLSATGLRSIRYKKEIEGLGKVIANDIDDTAYEAIRRNIALNDGVEVDASMMDAVEIMMKHRTKQTQFHIVDLDPYGSASVLLDSAVQAVADGGMLCVTCTDGPVLGGNSPEVCMYRYGAMSMKGSSFVHELALRIIMASIQRDANRYQRVVEPVLCVFIDFYFRLFIRVHDKKVELKTSPLRVGMLYQCLGCYSYEVQPLGAKGSKGSVRAARVCVGSSCQHCGKPYTMTGPVWIDRLYDPEVVKRLHTSLEDEEATKSLKMKDRVKALLGVVLEELPDVPFYYNMPSMIHALNANSIPLSAMFAALASHGYRVSQAHTNPNACKTNAPLELVWDILRCWVKRHPVRTPQVNSSAEAILSKEPTLVQVDQINFNAKYFPPGRNKDAKVARYPQNPTKGWGPGTRATGKRQAEDVSGEVGEEHKRAKTDDDAREEAE
ncbi:hypothetical protein NDN08_004925 [Rhodosorus marinus]|uniref:tRNA (guanine(26)-N(2))-dimethyltransferase n=1 Tax=Rhodosorus marinus TaxID=101924 RepID=A0AAV8UF22_9RHOD|nr:hypothetical protein NDN08_004925 [Rhodosorus marinus]